MFYFILYVVLLTGSQPRIPVGHGTVDLPRETRGGWHLLTVKTEANGDLLSTNESGPFLVSSLGKSFFSCFTALVNPVQNIFFLTANFFNLCVPIAKHPGRPAVQGSLSLNICLWTYPSFRHATPQHQLSFIGQVIILTKLNYIF